MDNLTVVAIIALVLLGVWFWLRPRGGGARQAERQLRSICLGDDRTVERLINVEMNRAPGISHDEAASRAVDRHQRDNR